MAGISLATKGVLCFGNKVLLYPVESIDVEVGVDNYLLELEVEDYRFEIKVEDIRIDLIVEDL